MQYSNSGNYWWFGINNKKDRRNGAYTHVIYTEVELFLKGIMETFEWHRQVRHHQVQYDDMQEGDLVLFWMGDGDFADWGIIGFGYIDKVFVKGKSAEKYKFRLKRKYIPEITIKPYENKNPKPTEVTRFLEETFGLSFGPLRTTFKLIGEKIKRTSPITIEKISKQQNEKCLEFTERLN